MSNLNQRYYADMRQFGGLLMVTGFCAIIEPLAGIVNSFNRDGVLYDDPSTIPFWSMVGSLSLFLNGIASVAVGFAACAMDGSHILATTFLVIVNQLTWIPYITNMVAVGKMADDDPSDQGLIPAGHNPSETDVKFIASMGVIAIGCYGFGYIGSMSFMAFSLHALNTGKYEERNSEYYQGRLVFYSILLAIAGCVQAAVGAYTAVEFGMGALDEGPIQAAMLVVNYPIISVLVGGIQMLHGLWGLARSQGHHSGYRDWMYQLSMAGQWIIVLCFQDVMQIAYFDLNLFTPLAAGIAAISFGLNMMPAYLDHKMRTTPEEIPAGYYIEDPITAIYPRMEKPLSPEQAPISGASFDDDDDDDDDDDYGSAGDVVMDVFSDESVSNIMEEMMT